MQWLGLFPAFLPPQSSHLRFDQIGIDNGLSAIEVRAFLQDRYGFTHYKHKPFDAASLTADIRDAAFAQTDYGFAGR